MQELDRRFGKAMQLTGQEFQDSVDYLSKVECRRSVLVHVYRVCMMPWA